LVAELTVPACSSQPQTHPLNTAPIPANAKYLEECSLAGKMACGAWSTLTGDAAAERRPACVAYRDSNYTLVETCGSLPASQP